jgi:hypothetical protein
MGHTVPVPYAPDIESPCSGPVLVDNLHLGHEALDADIVVGVLWQQELPGQLHLGRGPREVGQEAALLLDEKRGGEGLRLGFEDLDPLLELLDEVLQLHGARHVEVKVRAELGFHALEDRILQRCLRESKRGAVKKKVLS